MAYQPQLVDIEWAANTLREMPRGGVLAYKDARLRYWVDHSDKTITLFNPEQLLRSKDSKVTHERSIEVFKVIGYTVLEATPERTQELLSLEKLELDGENPRG